MERLTVEERERLGEIAAALDCSRVRLYRGGGSSRALRLLRTVVLWASRGRAVALGNHVFLPVQRAGDLGTLAHELTHCRQYQQWGALRYFTRGAEAQLRDLLHRTFGLGPSPYHYEAGKPLNAYGMEQQAQMVEDGFRNRLAEERGEGVERA